MAEKMTFIIESSGIAQRIDNFLCAQLKGVPKSAVYRLLRKRAIRVNGKRIKHDYRLVVGDEIHVPALRQKLPARVVITQTIISHIQSHILYEDADYLVLNKPSGWAVHAGSGVSYGLVDVLKQSGRPHINLVHRLDRETSGCLLLAKTMIALRMAHDSLRQGCVKKTYRALVKGHWLYGEKIHRINVALVKNQLKNGERMVIADDQQGKTAITDVRLLQSFGSLSLLEATLLTGRTHQIRVHLAYHGLPIVGDKKYGDKQCNQRYHHLGLKRLFLHADQLVLQLSSGRIYQFMAPEPDEWQQSIMKLRGNQCRKPIN